MIFWILALSSATP